MGLDEFDFACTARISYERPRWDLRPACLDFFPLLCYPLIMRIFLDESGSFSWATQGISLFCGLSVPDRELPALTERFSHWKRTVFGPTRREVKGRDLTVRQLASFCGAVLPARIDDIYLTLVGADTRRTSEKHVQRLRDQASELFRLSGELCGGAGNHRLAEKYRQMSGWAKNRSGANVLWIVALVKAVDQSLQHTVVRFYEPQYDSEFESLEIAIDRNFVRRDEHIEFWREWLRGILMERNRESGLITVLDWSERDHPFRQKYLLSPGLYDFKDLFVRHTQFHDSRRVLGLQVADICASICRRRFTGEPDMLAYRALRPRIVGEGGREITIIQVNEQSLHSDALSNHVHPFDIEEWKRLASEKRDN